MVGGGWWIVSGVVIGRRFVVGAVVGGEWWLVGL